MQGLASSARSSLVQQRCSFHTRFSGQRHSNRPHTVVLDHTLLTTHKRSSAWIHLGIVCSYEHNNTRYTEQHLLQLFLFRNIPTLEPCWLLAIPIGLALCSGDL